MACLGFEPRAAGFVGLRRNDGAMPPLDTKCFALQVRKDKKILSGQKLTSNRCIDKSKQSEGGLGMDH